MRILIVALLAVSFFTSPVNATPLSNRQIKKLDKADNKETLRDKMGKMIISIADLDILVNRDKVNDYEIFKEDAERILKTINEIQALDKNGVFKPHLKALKSPTEKLLEYSLAKNPKASKYAEQIFNACFDCHQAHRQY